MSDDTEVMARIGARVRSLRELHGVTQGDLAHAVGMNRTSITNLEGGRQNVPVTILIQIAAELKTTVGTLLGEAPMPDLPKVSVVAAYTVECTQCGAVIETSDEVAAEEARGLHLRSHLDGAPGGVAS